MSDKTETKAPKVIQLEVGDATLSQIAELMEPMKRWRHEAGHEDYEPMPGDVVLFAVAYLHETVFTKAHAILAAGREGPPVAH